MDHTIEYRRRVLRVGKRVIFRVLLGVSLVVSFAWGFELLRPSISRNRVRTATVDVGPLEATIDASGTVEPEIESVISSAISTRVLRILKRAGDEVLRGEAIVELDTSQAQLDLERVRQQIQVAENKQELARLELEEHQQGLESRQKISELALAVKSSEFRAMSSLFSEQLVSRSQLDQITAEKRKAEVELDELGQQVQQTLKKSEAQLRRLHIEMGILQKELVEARRQLRLATTKSDRDGILTWVVPEEGQAVKSGETIARIADLTSFHVRATVSDIHSRRITAGLRAVVRVNDKRLLGSVQSVFPTISEGIMTLIIGLESPSHALLRSNLRVDVRIITQEKVKTLRLKRGPAIRGPGEQTVFVVRGDCALRWKVRVGISSFDQFEIVSGLSEGDIVIISDMTDYMHLEEVQID